MVAGSKFKTLDFKLNASLTKSFILLEVRKYDEVTETLWWEVILMGA